jgi:HEAT repeat protein
MTRTALLLLLLCFAGCAKPQPMLAHGKPVQHWVDALHEADVNKRVKAVEVLGNVGVADAAAIPALAIALKDRDARVRSEAALALLRIGPPAREAVPALRDACKDKDATVRSSAAKALEKIDKSS